MKKFNDRLPFCLQLFADETSGENEGTETKDTLSTEGQGNQEKDKSSEKKYSDKDLDAILDKRFARWKADQEKEKKEAERLAEMNAQERAEAERDKVQKELDELKAKNAIAEMTNEARKMCAEHDINVGDDLLSVLVNKDADTTATKDGSIRTPSVAEIEITSTSILPKGDKIIGKLEKAMLEDKLVECWEVNLAEEGTETNAGKFKSKYYQGYLTECSISSDAEGSVEIELTFGANGNGADGYATVTKEQQEVASYVYKDVTKETASV